MVNLKFDLDPSIPRVVIIAILLFLEAILLPAYAILQLGRMPTDVEWLLFLFGALIQLVTYLLSFMGFEKGESKT